MHTCVYVYMQGEWDLVQQAPDAAPQTCSFCRRTQPASAFGRDSKRVRRFAALCRCGGCTSCVLAERHKHAMRC